MSSICCLQYIMVMFFHSTARWRVCMVAQHINYIFSSRWQHCAITNCRVNSSKSISVPCQHSSITTTTQLLLLQQLTTTVATAAAVLCTYNYCYRNQSIDTRVYILNHTNTHTQPQKKNMAKKVLGIFAFL